MESSPWLLGFIWHVIDRKYVIGLPCSGLHCGSREKTWTFWRTGALQHSADRGLEKWYSVCHSLFGEPLTFGEKGFICDARRHRCGGWQQQTAMWQYFTFNVALDILCAGATLKLRGCPVRQFLTQIAWVSCASIPLSNCMGVLCVNSTMHIVSCLRLG